MNTSHGNDSKKMADKKATGKTGTEKNSGKNSEKAVKKTPAKK